MCEPTTIATIATLVISAATATVSIKSQQNQAEAQLENQKQLTDSNNKVANFNQGQVQNLEAQQAEAAAREKEKVRLASQKTKATAKVTLGEAGVGGNTADALLAEYDAQQGQYNDAINRQRTLDSAANNNQIEALKMGAANTNLSINAPVAGPNYAAAILQFGSQALGAYKDYKSKYPKSKSVEELSSGSIPANRTSYAA